MTVKSHPDARSQDRFAFTWEGSQQTFQMLPQGYLHLCVMTRWARTWPPGPSHTLSHCFVILILADYLADLKTVVHSLKRTLLMLGWAIDKEKVQGPGLSGEFLGIIWSGKTRTMTVR